MTGIRTKRWAAASAVVFVASWLGGGCNKKEEPKQANYETPQTADRSLNAQEIDSLRSMKATHHVTRDEYWDGHGGVLANASLEVWYANGRTNILQGMATLKQMDMARQNAEKLFGRAPQERLVVICSGSLEKFRAATGCDWWQYSQIKGDTITLQSVLDLHTRGLLWIAVPREYYEWAIGSLSNGRVPRWIDEGLASHLSVEAPILEDQTQEFGERGKVMSTKEMERELSRESDRIQNRRAHYNAYRMTETLIQSHGRPAVLAFVLACGEEKDLDAASKRAFNVGYDALVEEARGWAATEAH